MQHQHCDDAGELRTCKWQAGCVCTNNSNRAILLRESRRKLGAVFQAGDALRAAAQFGRSGSRACADFQHVIAQLNTIQQPRQDSLLRDTPPNPAGAEPILKRVHVSLEDSNKRRRARLS